MTTWVITNTEQRRLRSVYHFLRDGGSVRRYHTRPVLRDQTVAEHTYGVMMFLQLLTDFQVSPELTLAALVHDTAEAHTGDLPAPMRRYLRGNGGDPVATLEEELLKENGVNIDLTTAEARLLKMADVLDGMAYCAQEIRMGNETIRDVYRRYREYAQELSPNSTEWAIIGLITEEVPDGQR